ncbi:MAG: oligosaccharide flippase family protein [Oceanihabitans sp.]
MATPEASYKRILKATSLFSGVQVFSIIISLIKSKIAAVLIGVTGIGILGVFNATVNLLQAVTKLGLDVSSVKEIALANSTSNFKKASRLAVVLKRLAWLTGVLGALLIIVFSSPLSKLAFNDSSYAFSFVLLSIAILFNQLSISNIAILQGFRSLKNMAFASVFSSLVSLIVAVPFYYFYGKKGIVPVLIISAFVAYLISRYFTKSLHIKLSKISLKQTLTEGKSMLRLGFVLNLGSLTTIVTAFIIQIFITKKGGELDIGFYNAGFVIINTYVSVIFDAMSKDYFPRLAEVSKDNKLMFKIVNQQALIAVLLITPIIILFIALSPLVVHVLYTEEFTPIIGMLTFGIFGTLFKAVSWAIGFVFIAKGDGKLYFKTEVIANLLMLSILLLSYIYYGITGVGVGFAIYYFIYLIIVKVISFKKYKLELEKRFLKIFCVSVCFCLIMLATYFIENTIIKYSVMAVLIISSCIFTFLQLDKLVQLKQAIKNSINKK